MNNKNKEWLLNLSSEILTISDILAKTEQYPDVEELCNTISSTLKNISKSMTIIVDDDK